MHGMLLLLQNFIKFSSSCDSPCYIAIVFIVMNKGEMFFDLPLILHLEEYIPATLFLRHP